MASHLGERMQRRYSGAEALRSHDQRLPFDVLTFWRWSSSCIFSNALRGVFAEFIVQTALGIDVHNQVKDEWEPWDIVTPEGIKIEVKATAYLQAWPQRRFSDISWDVAPKQRYDYENWKYMGARRWADIYVFCLYGYRGPKERAEPLNLDEWAFYVMTTAALNEHFEAKGICGKRITPRIVEEIGAVRLDYEQLAEAVGVLTNRIRPEERAGRMGD